MTLKYHKDYGKECKERREVCEEFGLVGEAHDV